MKVTDAVQHPYTWSSLTAFFSTLSLQDLVFVIGAVVSAAFTAATYFMRKREIRRESNQRLQMYGDYLKKLEERGDVPPPPSKLPDEVVNELHS